MAALLLGLSQGAASGLEVAIGDLVIPLPAGFSLVAHTGSAAILRRRDAASGDAIVHISRHDAGLACAAVPDPFPGAPVHDEPRERAGPDLDGIATRLVERPAQCRNRMRGRVTVCLTHGGSLYALEQAPASCRAGDIDAAALETLLGHVRVRR